MLHERRSRTGAKLPDGWEEIFRAPEWKLARKRRNDLYNWMKHDRRSGEDEHLIDFDLRFVNEMIILPNLLRFELLFDGHDGWFFDYLRMMAKRHPKSGVLPDILARYFEERGETL